MERGAWVGEGLGRKMWGFGIRLGRNKTDNQMTIRMNRSLQLIGLTSRMCQRPGIGEVPKNE